jgi:hypothetical protein
MEDGLMREDRYLIYIALVVGAIAIILTLTVVY